MALSVDEIRDALQGGDESIRHAAVGRLELAAPGALAVLVLALGDESWRVRRQAVERVAEAHLDATLLLDALVPLLAEADDVGLRNAAVEAVVVLGRASAPAVEAQLRGAPSHRKILADVLGRVAAPTSAPALVPLLDDSDHNVRIAAAEALGHIPRGDDTVAVDAALVTRIGKLVAAAPDDASELFLSTLLETVAKRRVALAPPLVKALLGHEVVGVAALRALGSGSAPRSVVERAAERALVVPELDRNVRVRREAALLALAELAPELSEDDIELSAAARAAAVEALLEGTVEVQRAAAVVLGATGNPELARPLLVASGDSSLIESVETALVRVARRDLPGLLAVAVSMVGEARAAGYRVLTQVASRLEGAESELLLHALSVDVKSEQAEVALAALGALGALGRVESVALVADALARAYEHRADLESAWDRIDAAQRALALLADRQRDAVLRRLRARPVSPALLVLTGRLGDATDLASLVDRLRDPDGEARRAASEAIAQLVARPEVALSEAQVVQVCDAARDLLADEVAAVRAASVHALAAVESRGSCIAAATVEALLGAARDEDVRVRGAAARALVDLASKVEGSPAVAMHAGLRQLADNRDSLTAVPALEALLHAKDPADDARLLDALTGTDDERRKVALHALALRPQLVTRGDLLKVVERALHDSRWDLRRAAVAALAPVGDAAQAALVNRRTMEEDALVLADLDRALGKARRG